MATSPEVQAALQNFKTQVEHFLSVYRFMPSEEKARFEAELQGHIKDMDDRTRKLYQALVAAAREGRDVPETIHALEDIDGRKVYVEE